MSTKYSYVILPGEKLKAFHEDYVQGKDVPAQHSFQRCTEVLASAIRHEKYIRSIQIGNEDIKLSLFTDDIIVYAEY